MFQSDVKTLVKTSVLPEVALPLQEELSEQWDHWEKQYEKGMSNYFMKDTGPFMVVLRFDFAEIHQVIKLKITNTDH